MKGVQRWIGEKTTISMYERLYEQFKIECGGAAHKRLDYLKNVRKLRRLGIRNLKVSMGVKNVYKPHITSDKL